ncbi:branched-chain amino acid ABC transporter permease [Nitratireductor sp. XY-223]|uniref:branched-chain amino acid ABC transporter permease n=1 Tax=Nitratireductor sp. XY-223 TaxID=2561926 RepID=UPI0010AAD03B|nr:branched-chain amino acid ABC transporter permease [Nitratireductor sp. XY-223]
MDIAFVAAQFLNGLAIAMILILIASGLTLLLGVLGILNFAHGGFYMLGAFMMFSLGQWGLGGMWFWVGLITIPLALALVAAVVEICLLRPLYHRERLYTLLLTFGLAMVFDDLALLIWGRDFKTVPVPELLSGAVSIGNYGFPLHFIFIIVVGPVVCALLWYLLYRTPFGKLIRAASTDTEMLGALGVNVNLVFTGVFALSAALAGLAGLLVAPIRSIVPGMGLEIFIESFIVVVIGGMGSLGGAIIGALLIGQIKAFGILALPNFAMIFIYLVLLAVLIVKPRGLFGEKTV